MTFRFPKTMFTAFFVLAALPFAAGSAQASDITLQYDDVYSIEQYQSGWHAVSSGAETVVSRQIKNGAVSQDRDAAVLSVSKDGAVHAVGTGTAELTIADLRGNTKTVSVTVEPAPLTVMYLAGQNNMEGVCNSETEYFPQASIVCPEGKVYSSFAPRKESAAILQTGLNGIGVFNTADAGAYIPASLTGTTSRTGQALPYPANALTAAGSGKTGPDSGLAYEWNRLTGEKVWTINAAYYASSITKWAPGGEYLKRAEAMWDEAEKTLQAEVAAGHYTISHRFFIWQHGIANKLMSGETYLSNWNAMYSELDSRYQFDVCGIISSRAATGTATKASDLVLTGPRAAQYCLTALSENAEIIMASDVNLQWSTDTNVRNYFKRAYPGGSFSYKMHSGTYSLPISIKAVHGGTQYSQIAQNENGITAARGIYQHINGATEKTTACWMDRTGSSVADRPLYYKSFVTLVPSVPASYGPCTVKYDNTLIDYNQLTGVVTAKVKSAVTSLQLLDSQGKVLASVSVRITDRALKPANVTMSGAKAVEGGVTVTWLPSENSETYRIYRKESGGTYSLLAKGIGQNSYTDTTATKEGVRYVYYVRGVNGSYVSPSFTSTSSVTIKAAE